MSTPSRRAAVLAALAEDPWSSPADVAAATGFPREMTRRALEQAYRDGVVRRERSARATGRGEWAWRVA